MKVFFLFFFLILYIISANGLTTRKRGLYSLLESVLSTNQIRKTTTKRRQHSILKKAKTQQQPHNLRRAINLYENGCWDVQDWYDSDGEEFSCEWYKESSEIRCGKYATYFENFGHTASTACCVCGGGIHVAELFSSNDDGEDVCMKIQAISTEKFLRIDSFDYSQETKNVLSASHHSDIYSQFYFEFQANDGSYKIKTKANSMYIHADGLGDQLLSTRYQQDDDYTRFYLEFQPEDSTYKIKVKADGRYWHTNGSHESQLTSAKFSFVSTSGGVVSRDVHASLGAIEQYGKKFNLLRCEDFALVTTQNCQAHGMLPIYSSRKCAGAVNSLGYTKRKNFKFSYEGYEDAVDGCSYRFNTDLYLNQEHGTCKASAGIRNPWTYHKGCKCTERIPCVCEALSYYKVPHTYCGFYEESETKDCSMSMGEEDTFIHAWERCIEDGPFNCMGVMWNSCEGEPTSDELMKKGLWKLITTGQIIGDQYRPTDTCGGGDMSKGEWDVYLVQTPVEKSLDIEVDCSDERHNIQEIDSGIGQTFFPHSGGYLYKISIWIEPHLFQTTSYKLHVYEGTFDTLLATSDEIFVNRLENHSFVKGVVADEPGFFDFIFISYYIPLKMGTQYSWRLENTSRYSGSYAPCERSVISGEGFIVSEDNGFETTALGNDNSFRLYLGGQFE